MPRGKGRGSFHPPANTFSIPQHISLLFSKEFLYLSFIRAFQWYQKPSLLQGCDQTLAQFNALHTCWWQQCQPGSLHTLCTSAAPPAPCPSCTGPAWLSLEAFLMLWNKSSTLCASSSTAILRPSAMLLWVCCRLFHHPSIFLPGQPGPEKSSKHLCKRKSRGRNEEREKGKPFTGHWIRAVTWPCLPLATNRINYKQLPFSSSCQK